MKTKAKRKTVKKATTLRRAPRGYRIVDAGRNMAQARSMVRDANAASKGDPSCRGGAKAKIVKKTGSALPFEIWVRRSCRWV